ncbi:MAG: hypothetical protein ACRD2D_09890 [Terriglobales bacterium]
MAGAVGWTKGTGHGDAVLACHALDQERLRPGFPESAAEGVPERVYNELLVEAERLPH